MHLSSVKLVGAGNAAAGRDREGDDEPKASLWRAIKLRGGGVGCTGTGRLEKKKVMAELRWKVGGQWRIDGEGAPSRTGRRGGRESAAGRGRRWQAVRPVVDAGAEWILSAVAVALLFFLVFGGATDDARSSFFSAILILICSDSFARMHGHS
jgi:hypothetical protein